eukprot:TRINITY_DN48544_c0_g1_i2.p1 TRINITY_DN48544_c0_g1~~TRINITY_DN48544_c0_g1_i2.p1  ORF type:complete len:568 (-),score=277.89 TRINITY_DN48544_c0_g1_i2:38-1741(-)
MTKVAIVQLWTLAVAAAALSVTVAVTAEVAIVQPSDWVALAAASERWLAHGLALPACSPVGTHNSFNHDSSTSIGIEKPHNQVVSIDVQLRQLGVRVIEVDPHFVDGQLDGVKVCHLSPAGMRAVRQVCNSVGWTICERTLGIGEHDTCPSHAPTLDSLLVSIAKWVNQTNALPLPHRDVLYLYLDRINKNNASDAIIDAALLRAFGGDVLFQYERQPDPPGWDPNGHPYTWKYWRHMSSWPTERELLASGKRVVVFVNHVADDTGVGVAFDNLLRHRITTMHMPALSSSECPEIQADRDAFFHFVVGDATKYSLFRSTVFDGTRGGRNFVTLDRVRQARRCGFSPVVDLMDKSYMEAAVWSWDRQQPAGDDCVVMSSPDGRWRTVPCSSTSSLPAACQRNDGPGSWRIHWKLAASPSSCPQDYVYAVPRSPRHNKAVLDLMLSSGTSQVLVNLVATTSDGDCFRADGDDSDVFCAKPYYTFKATASSNKHDNSNTSGHRQPLNKGIVIGGSFGVAGGVIVIFAIVELVRYRRRRYSRMDDDDDDDDDGEVAAGSTELSKLDSEALR